MPRRGRHKFVTHLLELIQPLVLFGDGLGDFGRGQIAERGDE